MKTNTEIHNCQMNFNFEKKEVAINTKLSTRTCTFTRMYVHMLGREVQPKPPLRPLN